MEPWMFDFVAGRNGRNEVGAFLPTPGRNGGIPTGEGFRSYLPPGWGSLHRSGFPPPKGSTGNTAP